MANINHENLILSEFERVYCCPQLKGKEKLYFEQVRNELKQGLGR